MTGLRALGYVEGRNIVLERRFADGKLERLPELVVETRDNDFARGKFGDLKVDVLLTSNPLFDQVRKSYTTTRRFVEQDIPALPSKG